MKRMYYYDKRMIRLKRFFLTEIWAVPLLFSAVNLGRVISYFCERRSLK